MKIICLENNFCQENIESNTPKEPIYFLKPDSALLLKNRPFYVPDFSQEVHHKIALVIRISRLGKNISPKFASRYYTEIGLGVDFSAADMLQKQKEQGLPWTMAKCFDSSAPLSQFVAIEDLNNSNAIDFRLDINGTTVQKGNSKDMLCSFDESIHYLSQYMTMKIGDFIFMGSPEGSGAVKIGDHIEGYIEDRKLLDFMVR